MLLREPAQRGEHGIGEDRAEHGIADAVAAILWPDSGMLGSRLFGFPRTPTVIQYWSSIDKLYDYAASREARHRPAWSAFNARARRAGDAVGIWHETYTVASAESIYVHMPPTGLGRATALQPVARCGESARERLRAGAPGPSVAHGAATQAGGAPPKLA